MLLDSLFYVWITFIVLLSSNLGEEICFSGGNTQSSNAQCSKSCRQKWAHLIQMLIHGNQEEFKTAVWPFANATKNSYTWRLDEPVSGWTLIRERNPVSGMHALAYQVYKMIVYNQFFVNTVHVNI